MASPRSGTQSLERAVLILKLLTMRGKFGWRLSDLAASCNLGLSTTHRILGYLARERLVQRRSATRRYVVGPLLAELGLSFRELDMVVAASRPALRRLARALGGVALLYLRSGSDFVCAARSGSASIRALSIDVGTRRPLIMSAGGAAILIALPKEEAHAIVARNLQQVSALFANPAAYQKMYNASEKSGYGANVDDILPGASAFGVAIRTPKGTPVGAITIAGSSDRLRPLNVSRVIELLGTERRRIEKEAGPYLIEFEGEAERATRTSAAHPARPSS
jgi:DNA-binding IclR family transcriptional regulator